MKSEQNVFCSILTKYRLYQFIALYRSLQKQTDDLKVFVLCMDMETYEILSRLKLENAVLILLSHIENKELEAKKSERGMNEYCWTLKPIFLKYVLDSFSGIERATYIDADLYFFDAPEKIFNEYKRCSILLSKHDFLDVYKHVELQCGIYNSGFISFKADKNSIRCLEWWEEKCMEWCFDRLEDGKFGDQKYLEMMPSLYYGVCDIKIPGVNVAPWNQGKYSFKLIDGKPYVNDSKLIFYHFCGFRMVNTDEYALTVGYDNTLIEGIHDIYIQEIKNAIMEAEEVYPGFDGYFFEGGRIGQAVFHKIIK